MTKQDFILIADVLAEVWQGCDEFSDHSAKGTVDEVASVLAVRLESAFPNFDREKFLDYVDRQKTT